MRDEKKAFIRFKENNHQNSAVPQAVLGDDFRINWANRAFRDLFHRENTCIGEHIAGFATLTGLDGRSLYHQLKDPATGYSFQGNGESRFHHHPRLFTNVHIVPILHEPYKKETVVGYCAYFHDATLSHQQSLRAIFSSLLEASRMKDNDTGRHIERVNRYSALMAESMYDDGTDLQVDRDFVDNISFLAAMHDVGKIGVPDDILNKAGPLESWEWEIMTTHTLNGAYILGAYPDPMAVEIARSHHERWDGSGYPYGLMEEMIPLSARIVTIADVYDALRSKRSYKNEMSHREAADLILLGRGTQFDPELVEIFRSLEEKFSEIYDELYDEYKETNSSSPLAG
ncbi:HD domain-containing phosphohydrolase [Marispirochaeta sp.]|jgi:HD-GYP domain-containing protein (c-di-GMP phosphodiesterase class II)|uniref:HD-GYP domain-containing protein n=1 Tax=Marispirochaeta sp. TaxID=2038653 RepID=UPI0029C8803A|nr:HD domain-containing phosphohydrolase [Marispirochaeta sp.]